jgi:hypothetical protein
MPRSMVRLRMDRAVARPACAQHGYEVRRCLSGSGLACRPSLAGWPRPVRLPHYLGSTGGAGRNNPSMLLSFERPASAGSRKDAPFNGATEQCENSRRYTPLHGP